MSAVFEGKGSANRYQPSKSCPRCNRRSVTYVGTTVHHGNPLSPAADVDLDHHYACGHPTCGHEWDEYV